LYTFWMSLWQILEIKMYNSPRLSLQEEHLLYLQFFTTHCLGERPHCSISFFDTTVPNFQNWLKSIIFPGFSLQEQHFLHLPFSTMHCLGEISYCISYLEPPVPNFLNRKKSIIVPWLSLQE
jgi:hypothetical protein